MNSLAESIALGNTANTTCEELKNFNQYFVDPSYDAFLIDTAVKNNALLFTLQYIYHK